MVEEVKLKKKMVEEWDMSADIQPKTKFTIYYKCLQNRAAIIKISTNFGKSVINL